VSVDPNTDLVAQAANGAAGRDGGRARAEQGALVQAMDGFRLTYRDGSYRVSLPNLNVGDGLDVVPKARAERADAQLAEAREALDHAVRALLMRSGFASHGHDGWVRDDEGCDTCYDTAWALGRVDLPNLERKYRSVRPDGPA
jgi:hypothetical protein